MPDNDDIKNNQDPKGIKTSNGYKMLTQSKNKNSGQGGITSSGFD